MYRHFPDRRELIIAVYADEVEALCARGEGLLEDQSPGDALFAWLRAFVTHVAAKRELALAIPDDQGGQRSALFDRWHKAMHLTASRLLARAQSSDTVSAGLNTSDLLALVSGIAVAAADADQAERCLALLRSRHRPISTPPAEPVRFRRDLAPVAGSMCALPDAMSVSIADWGGRPGDGQGPPSPGTGHLRDWIGLQPARRTWLHRFAGWCITRHGTAS
jgi:AcrR family transcriptional regulator